MNRRSVRIGVALGALAGGTAALVWSVRSRQASSEPSAPPPEWPPIRLDEVTHPDPVVPVEDRDAVVAPGPDPQPLRDERDGGPAGEDDEAQPPVAGNEPAAADGDQAVVVAASDVHDGADDATSRPEGTRTGEGDRWVEASSGSCPATHPVKAKLSSNIFHLPGMANYDRTRADRCYVTGAAAEADGLRMAKR